MQNCRIADDELAIFVIARCVTGLIERIIKCFCSLLEGNAVCMLIQPGFVFIPFEYTSTKLKENVHWQNLALFIERHCTGIKLGLSMVKSWQRKNVFDF